MPSFADSIFLFVLALLLFGPKKLPVLARELGKWIGEFRRASNEFKMQMEEELRLSEQEERQKQIAAMEAAAPVAPPLPEPEHPHLPRTAPEPSIAPPDLVASTPETATELQADTPSPTTETPETIDGVRPIPIASSGDLHMMPPASGLPQPRSRNVTQDANPLDGLLDSIPETRTSAPAPAESLTEPEAEPETAAHGD